MLITKWVGSAWMQISSNDDLSVCNCEKWGISLSLDGSLCREVNLEGLKDYILPTPHGICEYSLIESEEEEDKIFMIKKMKIQTRSKGKDN